MLRSILATLCLAVLAAPQVHAALALPKFGREDEELRIEVEFEGVDGPLLENVRAMSSLHRLAASKDLDAEMVGRLAQRAPNEARTALRPFGYYEPDVTTEFTETGDRWHVKVKIKPGTPVTLAEQQVAITGSGKEEPFLRDIVARSPLRIGEQLSHIAYDQLKGDLLRSALAHGYLDAGFTRGELIVEPATHSARAYITLETGERYRFGPTTIEQSTLRAGLVRRYLRYQEGDWYDAESLLRTQFALDDSQYFSVVEVLPEERDRKNKIAAVRITSEPNRRHVYKIAAGYGSDTGPRGTLGWEDRRLNTRGHRLHAELRGSDIDNSATFTYIVPWSDPALEKLSYQLRVFREQNADIETEGTTFKVGLTQVRGKWQRVLSVTLDQTEDTITTVSGGSTLVDRSRTGLLVPGITFARLPPDFLGVNTVPRGFQVELLASTETLGSDTNFTRVDVRDEHRFKLADKWHLFLRGEIGASAVGDFQELPASYRFYAGGDNSVRGYGYEELSPVDANGNKVGGRHLLTATVEFQRDLPKNLVGAVFMDAGNAFNKFGDPLEYSVGVGLRYRLPFLSVGLDVAQSISESDRGPRLHINFTPEF
jgi:translocation and assembly module TamA